MSVDLIRDYLELSKSRIVAMVLVTTAGGYLAAAHGVDVPRVIVVLLATALLAAGTNAMNEVLERHRDAEMVRTRNRPIPAGRISARAGLSFACSTAAAGAIILAMFVNTASAVVGLLTFLTYNFVYTPLKRVTPVCTVVGAIPGAAPPLIGWTAASGRFDLGGALMFSLLFFWQLPHFLAISWTHREDYRNAGFAMLSVRDLDGRIVARDALIYSLILAAVSGMPLLFGSAGPPYAAFAAALGSFLVAKAWCFYRRRSAINARRLFMASNWYLVGLMVLFGAAVTI